MKKLFIPLILAFTVLAGACGNETAQQNSAANNSSETN